MAINVIILYKNNTKFYATFREKYFEREIN